MIRSIGCREGTELFCAEGRFQSLGSTVMEGTSLCIRSIFSVEITLDRMLRSLLHQARLIPITGVWLTLGKLDLTSLNLLPLL